MKYIISKQAANDIEHIWLYTFENWSLEQADRYYHLILDEIENIAHDPLSGKDYGEVRKGYYCSRVKSHVILYRIKLNKKVVEIIRILHQQMDIESRLND